MLEKKHFISWAHHQLKKPSSSFSFIQGACKNSYFEIFLAYIHLKNNKRIINFFLKFGLSVFLGQFWWTIFESFYIVQWYLNSAHVMRIHVKKTKTTILLICWQLTDWIIVSNTALHMLEKVRYLYIYIYLFVLVYIYIKKSFLCCNFICFTGWWAIFFITSYSQILLTFRTEVCFQ